MRRSAATPRALSGCASTADMVVITYRYHLSRFFGGFVLLLFLSLLFRAISLPSVRIQMSPRCQRPARMRLAPRPADAATSSAPSPAPPAGSSAASCSVPKSPAACATVAIASYIATSAFSTVYAMIKFWTVRSSFSWPICAAFGIMPIMCASIVLSAELLPPIASSRASQFHVLETRLLGMRGEHRLRDGVVAFFGERPQLRLEILLRCDRILEIRANQLLCRFLCHSVSLRHSSVSRRRRSAVCMSRPAVPSASSARPGLRRDTRSFVNTSFASHLSYFENVAAKSGHIS